MLVQLTARVIEVNANFLVREALPVFEAAVGDRGTGGDVERFVRGWVVRLLAGGLELKDALALARGAGLSGRHPGSGAGPAV